MIKLKYQGKCGYCGQTPEKLQIDHVIPISGGGTNDETNLMPACFSCNNYKINMSLEQFRNEIGQQIYRARKQSVNFRLAERFGLVTTVDLPIIFYFEKVTGCK